MRIHTGCVGCRKCEGRFGANLGALIVTCCGGFPVRPFKGRCPICDHTLFMNRHEPGGKAQSVNVNVVNTVASTSSQGA